MEKIIIINHKNIIYLYLLIFIYNISCFEFNSRDIVNKFVEIIMNETDKEKQIMLFKLHKNINTMKEDYDDLIEFGIDLLSDQDNLKKLI